MKPPDAFAGVTPFEDGLNSVLLRPCALFWGGLILLFFWGTLFFFEFFNYFFFCSCQLVRKVKLAS